MKGLHASKRFHPSISLSHECHLHPCSAHDSFFFFNLFSPQATLYSLTHAVCPQPPPHPTPPRPAESAGEAIDPPFLFLQADLQTRPMLTSPDSQSDSGLIYKATWGRPAAPGPTGDDRSVQLDYYRVSFFAIPIVSTVA